jgi:predicted Zn-dependent protease
MDLKEPDFDKRKPGGVRLYHGRQYYEIIANAEAQQYVGEVGRRLVPRYQHDMPEQAPTKIPFRFYLVKREEASAVALPNGVVLVYSGLFEVMENEAQLAAAIGHEIAHLTQEHRWQLEAKIPGAFDNVYSRNFENQADRLGLRYMSDAGYDPREAARVWKLLTKKYGFVLTNAFGASHDNHALRRGYLMSELAENYRDLDYASTKTEKDPFVRMARSVKGTVDPGWKEKHDR